MHSPQRKGHLRTTFARSSGLSDGELLLDTTDKAKRLLRSCVRVGICCKATQAPNSFGLEAL